MGRGRFTVLRGAMAAIVGLGVPAVLAQAPVGRLEIIPLRHRPADQIVAAIRPLVAPGGALSAMGDKLVLRTSPANLAELRRAIEALDTPIRRLVISVRQGDVRDFAMADGGVGGIFRPGDSRVVIRGDARQGSAREQIDQQVEVIEGGQALIRVGQSVPLRMRQGYATPGGGWVTADSIALVDVGSGFYAAPQLVGEQVRIEIRPEQARLDAGGQVESARLATTVSGPLGTWIPLGGSTTESTRNAAGLSGAAQGRETLSRQVWLRVDALD